MKHSNLKLKDFSLIPAMPVERKVWEDSVLVNIMKLADVDQSEADSIIYNSDIIDSCYSFNLCSNTAAQSIMYERSMKTGTI